jgi:hypothetical protein
MKSRRAKFVAKVPLEYARLQMERAFPSANFDPDPTTLSVVSLPDINDVHVIVTALAVPSTDGRHLQSRSRPG